MKGFLTLVSCYEIITTSKVFRNYTLLFDVLYSVHCTMNFVYHRKICKCKNIKSSLKLALHVHMRLHSIYDFGA